MTASTVEIAELKDRISWLEQEMQRITECRHCYGVGAVFDDECPVCHGTGKNPATEQS